MTDTLDMFLRGVDVAKVEAERFPTLEQVRREAFSGREHRLMLSAHAVQVAAYSVRDYRLSVQGDALGAFRLALATSEAFPHRLDESITRTLAIHRALLASSRPLSGVTGEMHTGARQNDLSTHTGRTELQAIQETRDE